MDRAGGPPGHRTTQQRDRNGNRYATGTRQVETWAFVKATTHTGQAETARAERD